jgi:hypothetical protein
MIESGARPALRPRPLLAVLAVCACLLVAVLGLEYHSAVKRELRLALPSLPAASGAAIADSPATRAVPPSQLQPAPGRVGDWTRTALARPLFSPSRRPATVAVSGPQEPRLAGIVLGPSGALAIFAGENEARGTVAAVGQQAGSWKVLSISADSVQVIGPSGLRLLHPSRDPSGRSGDATAGSGVPLPPHPSILDLLRSRPLQIGPFNNGAPQLPAILRALPPAPPQ